MMKTTKKSTIIFEIILCVILAALLVFVNVFMRRETKTTFTLEQSKKSTTTLGAPQVFVTKGDSVVWGATVSGVCHIPQKQVVFDKNVEVVITNGDYARVGRKIAKLGDEDITAQFDSQLIGIEETEDSKILTFLDFDNIYFELEVKFNDYVRYILSDYYGKKFYLQSMTSNNLTLESATYLKNDSYKVVLKMDGFTFNFMEGQKVQIKLIADGYSGGVIIPNSLLIASDGKTFVKLCRADSSSSLVEVHVLFRGDNLTSVSFDEDVSEFDHLDLENFDYTEYRDYFQFRYYD